MSLENLMFITMRTRPPLKHGTRVEEFTTVHVETGDERSHKKIILSRITEKERVKMPTSELTVSFEHDATMSIR